MVWVSLIMWLVMLMCNCVIDWLCVLGKCMMVLIEVVVDVVDEIFDVEMCMIVVEDSMCIVYCMEMLVLGDVMMICIVFFEGVIYVDIVDCVVVLFGMVKSCICCVLMKLKVCFV